MCSVATKTLFLIYRGKFQHGPAPLAPHLGDETTNNALNEGFGVYLIRIGVSTIDLLLEVGRRIALGNECCCEFVDNLNKLFFELCVVLRFVGMLTGMSKFDRFWCRYLSLTHHEYNVSNVINNSDSMTIKRL